jgi:hypothetical protein
MMIHPVTPGYFATLDTPVVSGREFSRSDQASAESAMILNRPAARLLFGREDVIGREAKRGDLRFRIVGVVEGVRHWGFSEAIEPAAYVEFAGFGGDVPYVNVLIRSTLPPASLSASLRDIVRRADPLLPVGQVTTMEARMSRSVATPRFLAILFGSFAGVALLIAAGGVYGSMLYTVSQRRREMGIRLALGASGGMVVSLILRQGLAVTAGGLAGGLALAVASSQLMTSLIWGVEPTDPVTLVGVAAVLAAAALVACAVPAWRASRTNPLDTLRAE